MNSVWVPTASELKYNLKEEGKQTGHTTQDAGWPVSHSILTPLSGHSPTLPAWPGAPGHPRQGDMGTTQVHGKGAGPTLGVS